jgi:hypothetical protein
MPICLFRGLTYVTNHTALPVMTEFGLVYVQLHKLFEHKVMVYYLKGVLTSDPVKGYAKKGVTVCLGGVRLKHR